MDKLHLDLEYEWEPFTVSGQHLTFAQLRERELFSNECSHWGPAIYKWEGVPTKSERPWQLGILIGETDSIKQRIQQYATARAASRDGNAREDFLLLGDIRQYIFRPHNARLDIEDFQSAVQGSKEMRRERQPLYEALLVTNKAERRALYRQLLVIGKLMQDRPYVWLVDPGL